MQLKAGIELNWKSPMENPKGKQEGKLQLLNGVIAMVVVDKP